MAQPDKRLPELVGPAVSSRWSMAALNNQNPSVLRHSAAKTCACVTIHVIHTLHSDVPQQRSVSVVLLDGDVHVRIGLPGVPSSATTRRPVVIEHAFHTLQPTYGNCRALAMKKRSHQSQTATGIAAVQKGGIESVVVRTSPADGYARARERCCNPGPPQTCCLGGPGHLGRRAHHGSGSALCQGLTAWWRGCTVRAGLRIRSGM